MREAIRVNLAAMNLTLLQLNDIEAVGIGTLISIITSLPNYLYNLYLEVGERIAEAFATKEKVDNKTVINLVITPTKGAVLAALVGTPILVYVADALMDSEEFAVRIAGGTILSTAVIALVMSLAGMIVPDVLASLADVKANLMKKFKCDNTSKCVVQENILFSRPYVLP